MADTRAMYIYLIRPTRLEMLSEGPNEQEQEALSAHGLYLQSLLDAGRLVLAGRTQTAGPETFGICIFYAGSDEEAKATLAADPPVAAGVFSGEVFPYSIAFKGF